MATRLVRGEGDASFLEAMDGYALRKGPVGALLCRFSLSQQIVQPDALLAAVHGLISAFNGEVYVCKNRDAVIVWNGPLAQTAANLKALVKGHFRGVVSKISETTFFQFYDLHDQVSAVRAIFTARLSEGSATPDQAVTLPPATLAFSDEQLDNIRQRVRDREMTRGMGATEGLNILVVEDQEFSRKLLSNFLSRENHCLVAENASVAIELYAQHVPDMIYLDIELPDANGHEVAALIKQHDPQSFIIMVTANNYAADVAAAQRNKVQGYITKPFKQQKIRASLDAYIKQFSH